MLRLTALSTSLIALALVPARAQVLDPAKAHIEIRLGKEPPALMFYDSPSSSGDPVFVLDASGLKIDGRVVCTWPGARYTYDGSPVMMVLGYGERDGKWEPFNGGCPAGVPVISDWNPGGATLQIAVDHREGWIVRVEYRSRFAYLDLRSLPGDPREPSESFLRNLPRKGWIGWEWMPSEQEVRRRDAAVFLELQEVPAFSRFLAAIRSCLDSGDVVRCIPVLADPDIRHDGRDGMGLAGFLTYLVQRSVATPGESVVSELRRCFGPGGRFRDLGAPRYVQFVTESGYVCEVQRVDSGYVLAGLWLNPD